MFGWIYRIRTKRRIIREIKKTGFVVTGFEFLPNDNTPENQVSITPIDGYDHTDEDCLCGASKVLTEGKDGEPFFLTTHRDMELNL